MTLIEALKSGKRIRRAVWAADAWESGSAQLFSRQDVLATDWEIEEPKKKRKLYAYIRAASYEQGVGQSCPFYGIVFSDNAADSGYRVPQFDVEVDQ